MTDAERWQKLAELTLALPAGGWVAVCAAPANEYDKPWASVQGHNNLNPRETLWFEEAETLDKAMDAVILKRSADDQHA